MKVIGPFSQIVTMDGLSLNGAISDDALKIIENGGILIDQGFILEIDEFSNLNTKDCELLTPPSPSVALPGLIDAHTHICYAGSRAKDYALRVSGTPYQEIAARGGGILDTVSKTREATQEELLNQMLNRLERLLNQGITTCEVKSGYGLTVEDELKMLRAINEAASIQAIDLVPTCLAAHTVPKEYSSSNEYLKSIIENLFPLIQKENLTKRIDIFIEDGAFSTREANEYLNEAKKWGFSLCVHANQFSTGGAEVAAKVQATSVDHLELMSPEECQLLKNNNVIAVVLPGASLGLGMPFAPARMMLDEGLPVAIASDWNPGSAPMGQLLMQAATIGASEKLTVAETLAGITFRAAAALSLRDRGMLRKGLRADIAVFPCADYREVLYHQGSLLPSGVIINGKSYLE